jgi:hypothetical protein
MRRTVTGHSDGRAVIALQGAPPTIVPLAALPGTTFYEIWNTPANPQIDNGAGSDPEALTAQASGRREPDSHPRHSAGLGTKRALA